MRWRLAVAALLVALGALVPVAADELRPAYVEFSELQPGEWRLVWKAPLRGGLTPATRPHLPANCRLVGAPSRELRLPAVVTRSAAACDGPVDGQQIGLTGFDAAQTDALARVASLGRPVQTLRLTAAQPTATIAAVPGRWAVAQSYFVIGVEHIMFGYDHLLFVIALVLLLDGLWRIAAAVTAFTIAHSVTLVGTTLGIMGLPSAPVETIIALSILFLAVEIVKRDPAAPRLSERVPWLVAFAFGLLHGFGFAGALAEIGLPESDVALALLTFNLGVEAGQLAVVLVSAALLALLRRLSPPAAAQAVRVAAYAIGSTAAWWTIDRLTG
jgi:hydrogenase/urease accessory protein HupE